MCNPNNPSGTLVSGAAIRDFVAAVAGRATVPVDNAYLEFAPDAARHSAVARVVAGDEVIVMRTFSNGRPFPPYLDWCRVSMGTVGEMRAFDRALREHYASRPT